MAYTVLVVNDSRYLRENLRELLEKAGCEVVDTDNGISAVTLYSRIKPDLVMLDVLMPDQDGIETLKQILNIDKNANVVMVTDFGLENYLLEARELGASGCIIKPFKLKHLKKVLAGVLDEEFFYEDENSDYYHY